MKEEIDKQKRLHPESDSTAFEADMVRAETMFADQSRGARDADGEVVDKMLLRFESQDGTVDRCFHFIMKLVEANSKAPSLKIWKKMLSVVRRAGGRQLKQDELINKLQRTGLPIFKNLVFDSQASGGRMHKYQHPYNLKTACTCLMYVP